MIGWVKCSERMPEVEQPYFALDEIGVAWTVIFEGGKFVSDTPIFHNLPVITHWMEIPELP